MVNEKRLIDADALKKAISAESWVRNNRVHLVLKYIDIIIDDQPTVDAVQVVRCKDCKHYKTITCSCGCNVVSDNWYCADGERRTNG